MLQKRGRFSISTDKKKLDRALIHKFLSERSYWATGIPRRLVERGIKNSLCFGVYDGKQQVGFARVISDYATYAYVADVFVLETHRGQGLSKWLMQCIRSHRDLQGLRRWVLTTRDAHGLYQQFGFYALKDPGRFMEITIPDIYLKITAKDDKSAK